MTAIPNRLALLREELQREHLSAFVFPTSDPHNSEYTADHWKGREWISGFNGSAGIVVVTLTSAALWTDSRYFIAAAQQLAGTEFQLMKQKVEGTPTIAQWLGSQLADMTDKTVGIDGSVNTVSSVQELIRDLRREGGITLRTNFDPLQRIWHDRPAIPQGPVVVHPIEYAGETARAKIARIRTALRNEHADGMLMAALDDIAWTLNLRGDDVHCNPVFVSYLLISTTAVTLFVDPAKLTASVEAYLKTEGVGVVPYDAVCKGLQDYFEYNILIDPDEVNYTLYQALRGDGVAKPRVKEIIQVESPVKRMKTVKNATEIAGFHSAMLRDGIAMVQFLHWLHASLLTSHPSPLTELSVSAKLEQFRAAQPLYCGLSFDTIAAYGAHGAIVHYEPTPESDILLKAEGFLLLDSGAQYLDGTTDITRTIALGPLTDEQRRVYTLVLKGHIQTELCKFPAGASGTQLDVLARQPLWRQGLNYLHGTGHGVGSYLNVHEGPHQIRMEWRPAPLVAGMTVTDEPGIYLEGRFGVRIENTLLVTPYMETEFGQFLQFESLTLCPIDTSPILTDLLLPEETQWLNSYHRHVYETLASHLDDAEREWLRQATQPI